MIEVLPVGGISDVSKGDNLGKLIVSKFQGSGNEIRKGDIVVVAQKVVSKDEGRTVSLFKIKPSKFASEIAKLSDKDPRQVEVILRESAKIVRMKDGHLITETKHGFVCANSGVDTSNVGKGSDTVTLLPVDPDKSAASISSEINRVTGLDVPVIVTDTFGRAWRPDHANFPIQLSRLQPLNHYT